MGSNSVKGIIFILVLVVLSVLIGTQVSDSLSDSLGAFFLIGAVVMLMLLVWLGEKSWYLCFLLPTILLLVHGRGGLEPFGLSFVPLPALVGTMVISYWVVMWAMGYTRMTWYGHAVTDILAFLVFAVVAVAYIRNPVGFQLFGNDVEAEGGRYYAVFALAFFFYIGYSCMPTSWVRMAGMIKWFFLLSLGFEFLFGLSNLLGLQHADARGFSDIGEGSRFWFWQDFGLLAGAYAYAAAPISKLLFTPRYLGLLLMGAGCELLTGYRWNLLDYIARLGVVVLVKREVVGAICLAIAMYAFLFLASVSNALLLLPSNVQRPLSVLPGIKVDWLVEQGSRASSDWRREVWSMTMDPRSGIIRDYVWGDGFYVSMAFRERDLVAKMRRTRTEQERRISDAMTGQMHHGMLDTIQKFGYVGASVFILFALNMWMMIFRILVSVRRDKVFPYMAGVLLIPFGKSLSTCISYGHAQDFASYMTYMVLIKVIYRTLEKEGRVAPLFAMQRYVPMTIRELEQQQ